MRYIEILEAARDSNPAARAAELRKRARDLLDTANRKRSDAIRKSQDDLRSASDAAIRAKAQLRASALPEQWDDPRRSWLITDGHWPFVACEGRRAGRYEWRDNTGLLLGWRESAGRILQARDRSGSIVGWYDPQKNQTRDRTGRLVGEGDLLSALLRLRT